MKKKILIADDEMAIRELLSDLLSDDYAVSTVKDGAEVLEALEKEKYNLLLLDLRMPKIHGMDILRQIRSRDIPISVIVITADKDADNAIEAMKLGVYDYIIKPFDNDKIRILVKNALKSTDLQKEVDSLRKEIHGKYTFENIIGRSKKMRDIMDNLVSVMDNDSIVLISGESGSGKEIIARTIHYNSHRKDGPFITVDISAIPDNMVESELFGHTKGAFPGADSRHEGKFELAMGGTLFLDEIGHMRNDMQANLLRTLQDKQFSPVGSKMKVDLDTRIICASNMDLEEAVENGSFRKDLFYLINVIPINLPPLRDRKEDIPLLIAFFLEKYNNEMNKNVSFSKGAYEVFQEYYWPGNIRELENMVQRLVVMKNTGIITENDLPKEILESKHRPDYELPDGLSLEQLERKYIFKTLREFNWNISKTARALGITRKTLHNKLNRYEAEGTMKAELEEQQWMK